MRHRGWTVGIALVGLLLAPGVAGAKDAETFDEDLEKAVALCVDWKGEAAVKALCKAVEKHGDRPYVRERRKRIIDLLATFLFVAARDMPPPDRFLTGDVRRYDHKTGKIEVVYTPKTAGGLLKGRAGVALPVGFMGPFTIEVEGNVFQAGVPPSCSFGYTPDEDGDEEYWAVSYGAPEHLDRSHTAASFHYIARTKMQENKGRATLPARNGEPYTATLSVGRRAFKATLCGKELLKEKKRSDLYGWAYVDFRNWTRMTFKGEIDRIWMSNQAQLSMADELPTFLKTFDPAAHLPDWLLTE